MLSLVVNVKGRAEQIRVIRSDLFELEDCAMRSLALWEFVPGRRDNKPVPVQASVEMDLDVRGKQPLTADPSILLDCCGCGRSFMREREGREGITTAFFDECAQVLFCFCVCGFRDEQGSVVGVGFHDRSNPLTENGAN